jgi:hypothetical protein
MIPVEVGHAFQAVAGTQHNPGFGVRPLWCFDEAHYVL